MAGSDRDKRTGERMEILGELQGEVTVVQPIVVGEISSGGAEVVSQFPLQLDSLHDFRLMLGNRSVVLKGRVVHSRISDVDSESVSYRSGIDFIDPPERVSAVLSAFIDGVKDSRRG